ncbi:type II toxin-antitoxin system VapC family toxin [Ilyomonas limi]|uniref:Ribonuclease VapC n=1 Tax=Ilyomonas limi TaxID=2575867 RepID=A0A4U3KPS7_9BACT|nr:type II toxin-antitoxin system VapC family toxin [Ilyomonas limi]TKK64091.1 type II toxin-antitoxin system VapC family toxin [Ilyomonas limi]
MADKIILIDTSVLIDYFRKTDKENAALVAIVKQGYTYCISSVTEYEIYRGALLGQIAFWDNLLLKVEVLPFDKTASRIAVDINSELKRKRKQIEIADLFIAATAVANGLKLATLNKKHFDRIEALTLMN